MKCLSLLLVACLAVPGLALADVITLKDGTKMEGEIKRAGDSYLVRETGGKISTIAADRVASIEVRPQALGDASMARLNSLRRAVENIADIKQIIDRYRSFIDQNANTPASDAAQKDLALWQDRQDRGLVKVGDKWMTEGDREAMRAKSVDIAFAVHDMLKQGRLKEASTTIEKALVIDPQNPSLLYLHGVQQYTQELIPVARKSFEAVLPTAPDHAPTLNNLGVILYRQKAYVAALGYYDRALLAAPSNREILDNVAEALNSLSKEFRESAVTKKLVRHFKEQDDAVQKQMAEKGLYRWGGTWVTEKELKKLQEDEKAIKNQIKQMETDFGSLVRKIGELDRKIGEVVNEMNIIDAQTYVTGADGKVYRVPYPPIYFTLTRQLADLRGERAARVDDQERLRKTAKQAQASLPAPKYTGIQKLIDADGMPVPAGVRPPEPPPASQPNPAARVPL